MKTMIPCFLELLILLIFIFSGCTDAISPDDESLTTPNDFCVTPISDKAIQISWSKGNASIFNIERRTGNDSAFSEIGSTTNPFYFDYNLDSSKSYYYRVQASRKKGDTTISIPFQIDFVSSNQLIKTISNNNPINEMILSPDGNYLAFSDGLTVNIINTTDWSIQRYSNNNTYCHIYTFTPNSQTIFTGELSYIKVRSVIDGTVLQSLNTDSSSINALAITQDGQQLVSYETKRDKYLLRLWNVLDGTVVKILDSINSYNGFVIRPDSNILIACSGNGLLRVWELTQQKLIYQNAVDFIYPVINHNGSLLAVNTSPFTGNGYVHNLEYFRTADFSFVYSITLPWGSYTENPIAFSPDNNLQLIGNDNQVKIAQVSDGTILRSINAHTSGVVSVAFFPDSKTFATGSYDGTIKIWSITLIRQWTIIQ